MAAVRFSAPPQIPGLPFQHPQREPLRQIAEDYGLSQGPHWERSEGLSSAGWMESTHLLCRIPAGRGPVQAREAEAAFSLVFQFGVRLQREQKLTLSPPHRSTPRGGRRSAALRGPPRGPLWGRLISAAAESFGTVVLNRHSGIKLCKTESDFKKKSKCSC